jgi:hypothetical protein
VNKSKRIAEDSGEFLDEVNRQIARGGEGRREKGRRVKSLSH